MRRIVSRIESDEQRDGFKITTSLREFTPSIFNASYSFHCERASTPFLDRRPSSGFAYRINPPEVTSSIFIRFS